MDDTRKPQTLDEILEEMGAGGPVPTCLKNDRGTYIYANEGWSELATTPLHKLTGRGDEQLPWGPHSGQFIRTLDHATRSQGRVQRIDRLAHFEQRVWMRTATNRRYLRREGVIVCQVAATYDDDFCQLANQVTEQGIAVGDVALSVKQLYLLHQLLFQVPQKQTARELGCSTTRINQYLRQLRERFAVDDNMELICTLSGMGLFPLLERLELLFKEQWIPAELKFH